MMRLKRVISLYRWYRKSPHIRLLRFGNRSPAKFVFCWGTHSRYPLSLSSVQRKPPVSRFPFDSSSVPLQWPPGKEGILNLCLFAQYGALQGGTAPFTSCSIYPLNASDTILDCSRFTFMSSVPYLRTFFLPRRNIYIRDEGSKQNQYGGIVPDQESWSPVWSAEFPPPWRRLLVLIVGEQRAH